MDRRSLALMAALLLHTLLFGVAQMASRWRPRAPAAQAPLLVEMEPAPETDALKRKLLLSRRPPKTNEPPPPDARYFSDRNQRVEKETRARNGDVADLSRLQSRSLQESLKDPGNSPSRTDRPKFARGLRGEAQRLDDDRLTEGAENLLNTVQSLHYSFYSRMYGSLAPVWQSLVRNSAFNRALSPGDYTVVADLVLDEKGNLIGVEFRERSPIERLNEVVVASARKVGKFPNPPRELISETRQVRTLWSFTVNVDENSLLRLAPPRRIN